MEQYSVTVTTGADGSEAHNHDVQFRSTLEHVTPSKEDGVIELIPYRPYDEVIDEIMAEPIIQYVQKRIEEYVAALERYESGERKTKPSPRPYGLEGPTYTSMYPVLKQLNPNTGRVEERKHYRSLIIGIGDQYDRANLDLQVVIDIFRQFIEDFKKAFSFFYLLGATLHGDERGFYHTHIDYFVAAPKENWKTGLPVYRGQDKALELMGIPAEQSIIGGDKPPIRFNGFRNRIYKMMEKAMEAHGIYLQYGVTRVKHPETDPGKRTRQEMWTATQDLYRALQQFRNEAICLLNKPEMQLSDLKSCVEIINEIRNVVDGRMDVAPIALFHGYRVTTELLDRYVEAAVKVFKGLEKGVQVQVQNLSELENREQILQTAICDLKTQHAQLQADCSRLREMYQHADNLPPRTRPERRQTFEEMQAEIRAEREREARERANNKSNSESNNKNNTNKPKRRLFTPER